MGKINLSKVILGGIGAGIAAFVTGFVVWGILMKTASAAMVAAGVMVAPTKHIFVYALILNVIEGILGTYAYALARPRLGASYGSALHVALYVGVFAAVLSGGGMLIWSPPLMAQYACTYMVSGFAVMTVATFVGAWIYTD